MTKYNDIMFAVDTLFDDELQVNKDHLNHCVNQFKYNENLEENSLDFCEAY